MASHQRALYDRRQVHIGGSCQAEVVKNRQPWKLGWMEKFLPWYKVNGLHGMADEVLVVEDVDDASEDCSGS